MAQALSGVRVLDFGRYVAGPYCATLLAYLGADVIRVEKQSGGEDRYIQPLEGGFGTGPLEGSLMFQTGCNKRSLGLDLSSEAGRQVVERLVATADVVVANLPQLALTRLGLDYGSLSAIRPDIILVTQSAFGSVGPDRDKPGFDGVAQAMSGAMSLTGLSGAPVKAAAPYVDYATAVLSAFGAMAALRERDRTGRGQIVEAALLRTALSVFGAFVTEQAFLGLDRVPSGNRVQTSGPSDCFACRDGHVLVHVVGEGLFRRLARVLAAEDWLSDPDLKSDAARGLAADRLCGRLGGWCSERTVAQVLDQLQSAGIPCGAVLSLREAVQNPQVTASAWLKAVDFPGFDKPVETVDLPLSFSAMFAGIDRRPPLLGEHTGEILAELGYGPDELDQLRHAGAISGA